MREIFKPEDFYAVTFLGVSDAVLSADAANKKFNKLIESWPVVYFSSHNAIGELKGSAGLIIGNKQLGDTHKARLAFVEEIPKEPCKHTVASHRAGNGPWVLDTEYDGSFTCGKCGVKLEIQWKEKES